MSAERASLAPEAVYGFPENAEAAGALATALGLAHIPVEVHRFPDGESKVRVPEGAAHAIVLRSLHEPNAKLMELAFTAAALRDVGTLRITLVAPYLSYMRQDKAFRTGEAVSQRVMGEFLADRFDRFVSIDPHLHRTPVLADVFRGKPALTLTAAPAISSHIRQRALGGALLLLGPDEESQPWVSAVAGPLGASWATGVKRRYGDRDVKIELPADLDVRARNVIMVDDVISSGGTLRTLAGLLRQHAPASLEAYTTHALFSSDDADAMHRAGVDAITSCNTVPHRTNGIDVTPLLAEALRAWR